MRGRPEGELEGAFAPPGFGYSQTFGQNLMIFVKILTFGHKLSLTFGLPLKRFVTLLNKKLTSKYQDTHGDCLCT